MTEIPPEEIPAEWVEAAKAHYSMHGAGLIRNILAGAAPVIRAAERAKVQQLAALGGDSDRSQREATELRAALTRTEADRDQAQARVRELEAEVERATRERNAERDVILAGLGDLLEATGLGNYARLVPAHDVMQEAIAKVRELDTEVIALREMITAKPNGIVRIEGDLTPEAAAAVKMLRPPDGCRCIWTLMLPEGEFRRDEPDPSCTADHGEPAPAQTATDSATPAASGRKARGATPRTGKSAAGRTEPHGGDAL